MRIFLDANILFSAAKSDGAVRRLLDLMTEAGHELVADGYVIEEARRNLALKTPRGLAALRMVLRRIEISPIHSNADLAESELLALPEKDRPILAAAIRAGCYALVTGDRTHFGGLYGKTVRGVAVHSPRSLAEKLDL